MIDITESGVILSDLLCRILIFRGTFKKKKYFPEFENTFEPK